ncbi:hypothetical protein GCM10018954_029890 [Kutzneria kofuensis]
MLCALAAALVVFAGTVAFGLARRVLGRMPRPPTEVRNTVAHNEGGVVVQAGTINGDIIVQRCDCRKDPDDSCRPPDG